MKGITVNGITGRGISVSGIAGISITVKGIAGNTRTYCSNTRTRVVTWLLSVFQVDKMRLGRNRKSGASGDVVDVGCAVDVVEIDGRLVVFPQQFCRDLFVIFRA